MKNVIVLLGCTILIMASCSKDELGNDEYSDETIELRSESNQEYGGLSQESEIQEGMIILGEEIEIPHTTRIVNEAYEILYETPGNLSTTHNYVKFMPRDYEDLVSLNEWAHINEIVVLDFPFHREVLYKGDYYIDPAVEDSLLTYQYTTVEVNQEMPDVPYELLEELYLDETNPFLFIQTFRMTGFNDHIDFIVGDGIPEEVVNNYMPLGGPFCGFTNIPPPPNCGEPACSDCGSQCGDCDTCQPRLQIEEISPDEYVCEWICVCADVPPPPENACGCPIPFDRKRPAGCVQVENDAGFEDPVIMAKVIVWDWGFLWFRRDVVETDIRGCWEVGRQYDECTVRIVFENDNLKVRNPSFWIGLRIHRDRKLRFDAPPLNNIHRRFDGIFDEDQWASAHTLNTDFTYRQNSAIDGIPQPRQRLQYWLLSGSDNGPGSAAMLQGNPANSQLSILLSFYFPLAVLNILTSGIQPDITNIYDFLDSADEFNGITMHELGHASHHAIVGESYWFGYRNHIINNFGYGTFPFNTGNNFGKVALGEAIGNFTGAIYGGTNAGGENSEWQNNFIPRGLMWDLMDTVDDRVTDPNDSSQTIMENIEGFSPFMIFDGLRDGNNEAQSIREYRDILRTKHLGSTPNNALDYNNVVDVYDVVN